MLLNHVQDVSVQDATTDINDLYFHEHTTGLITLTAPTALDDVVLYVQAGHGAVAGELVCLKQGTRYYQGEILSTTATTIILDSPLDFAFDVDAICTSTSKQMSVDGSIIPAIFHIKPSAGVRWDITRVIFYMEDTSAMDLALFGSLPAITNGIVVRKKDGIYHNIFNAKKNGDFNIRAYDGQFLGPNLPVGVFGFQCRRSFNGPDKNGVVIRLDGDLGDELQILVRDDISGMTAFNAVAQGHVVLD